jgi:hypothetical protein
MTAAPPTKQTSRRDLAKQGDAIQLIEQRACDRCGKPFMPRTGRRIIAGEYGTPPVVTRLSPRRIGISLANNAAWQASRERAAS